MSKYTTEVRFICETLYPLNGDEEAKPSVNEIVQNVHSKVFNFEYPIFDEVYRTPLEIKILKHFYTREIGEETVALWKLRLDTRLNEIMPYYNELYKSALIEYNPLYNVDLYHDGTGKDITDHQGKGSSIGTGTEGGGTSGSSHTGSANKNSRWVLYSDTPQGGINGISHAEDDPALGTDAYLTNATHIIDDGTGSTSDSTYNDVIDKTSTNNVTTTNDYIANVDKRSNDHTYGYNMKNPAKSIKEFRENILNIDLMVLKDLEDLFLNLW